MQSRIFTFLAGINQSAQPDPGTPVETFDVVPFGYLTSNFGPRERITGSLVSPYVPATAGTPIAHGLLSTEDRCFMYIEGPSVATLDLSNNPQIVAGTRDGQELTMLFTHDTKRIKFEDGNGLSMKEGDAIISINGTALKWRWDGTNWRLIQWNNVGEIV